MLKVASVGFPEVFLTHQAGNIDYERRPLSSERQGTRWREVFSLIVWALAAVVAFLSFAYGTSAWDAVRFHVPGNQGNWWHLLAGIPFFLAYPMVWLRLRSVSSTLRTTARERSILLGIAGLSTLGTVLVELPFLLHLAGTSDWQRFVVLGLGFGTMAVSAFVLWRRGSLSPTQACIAGIETAYLANMLLCLVVYSSAVGSLGSRSGWVISMVIVWPLAFELVGCLVKIWSQGE